MLATYRRVLTVPGALTFCLAGLVARLPISTVGLGIVLLVSADRGSYGAAGTVSAAYVLANAALAVVHGRLADRWGQHRSLPTAVVVFALAMTALVWAVESGQSLVLVHACAAAAGAAYPQIGSCVRTRWSHVLRDPGQVQTAYALEAVVDETIFVLGPVLVTFLAVAWHPVAGLSVAVVAGVSGTFVLAAQRATQPPPHRHDHATGPRPRMPWATIVPLTVVSLALGGLFGATEVSTVAFAEELGAPQLAGVLLALWALGSLTSGLVTGAIHWRGDPALRVRWGMAALALTLAPLTFIGSLPLMGVVLLLGGLAISPTLIATLAATERSVPAARLTEGMSVLSTGMAAGVAPGAALAGAIVDSHGASAAYLVATAAGALGTVAALATRRTPTSGVADTGAHPPPSTTLPPQAIGAPDPGSPSTRE
ncbi:MFS transporter [Myroides odoratimimus subsp. xuanwuensis]